ISFKQHGIDVLVTPNHRMAYYNRSKERQKTEFNNKLEVKIANDLITDSIYSIPIFGNWIGKSKTIKIGKWNFSPHDFLPFLGWFLTDGSLRVRSVVIGQTKKKNFDSIRDSLERLNFIYRENQYKRNGKVHTVFNIHNKEFRDELKKWFIKNFGKYEKRIPREIFNLEKEELLLLFKTMFEGDGGWDKNKNKYYSYDTTKKDLADDFQELALRIGLGCNIKKEFNSTRFDGKENQVKVYRCRLSYYGKNIIKKHHSSYVDYKGVVWCVKTNNGIVVVRRNGKPFVSGNSLYPSIIKERNLSYETILCRHEDCKENKIPGTPYWVCTKRIGIVSEIVGFLRDIRVFWLKEAAKKATPEKKLLDVLQRAFKVLLNASYGVLGATHFALYCLPTAESTTAVGRWAIAETIKKAEEDLGVKVLYGDTDSVFLLEPTEKQIDQLIQWSEEVLGMPLEAEKTYRYCVLSERKKNYFGVYAGKKGDVSRVDVKGLSGKKRNVPNFIQNAFREMLAVLADVQNPQEFDEAREKLKKIVRQSYRNLEKKVYPAEDLAFAVQMTKPLKAYTVKSQHTKAAQLLIDRGKREKVEAGEIIRFLKVIDEPGVMPLELADPSRIDIKAYKAQIDSVFSQVIGALDIPLDELHGKVSLTKFFPS
ncbi:MAG: DNA polymerase domain-containing protein, partial [Promethearchaeota archaeon]